jgi:hypothetical protein
MVQRYKSVYTKKYKQEIINLISSLNRNCKENFNEEWLWCKALKATLYYTNHGELHKVKRAGLAAPIY